MGGPNDLGVSSKYVTTAEVEASYTESDSNLCPHFLVWVADADDWIYEAQVETASQETFKGAPCVLVAADALEDELVNTTTGLSKATLAVQSGANISGPFIIHSVPRYLDNDPEAADARVWVYVNPCMTPKNSFRNDLAGSDAVDTAAS